MAKTRILIFLLTVIVIVLGAYSATMYAKGLRLDKKTLKFRPSGLLVVKSEPDGAQIFINGELKGATNSNFSLPPDTYDLSIRKDGYLTWNKRITVEKEVVTEANANLFKQVPSLSAVTFSGCATPLASPDFTKIAYIVPATGENTNADKEGLWIIETVNLPLGFSRDPRRITDGNLKDATWSFSPDGRQILLSTQGGKFLLDTGSYTPQAQRVNILGKVADIEKQWQKESDDRFKSQTRGLPDPLVSILKDKSDRVLFSPDERKIMYSVTKDAALAEGLIKPIPGASTQPEQRQLKAGNVYVYDIKEDRNFLIASVNKDELANCKLNTTAIQVSCSSVVSWFPTSAHVVLAQPDKITIMDYDGTNKQDVYSGSYMAPFAFPVLSNDRLLILTNLGANSSTANLYSVSLK
jgi:hypothetical protein